MNIKEKLIEQISILEKAQQVALGQAEPSIVANISTVIIDYIKHIEDYENEDDYICPECEEVMVKEMLHQDIANACDLPIEIVNRVMMGQDEVLNME